MHWVHTGSDNVTNSRWWVSTRYLCSWVSRWLALPQSAGGNAISLSMLMHYLFHRKLRNKYVILSFLIQFKFFLFKIFIRYTYIIYSMYYVTAYSHSTWKRWKYFAAYVFEQAGTNCETTFTDFIGAFWKIVLIDLYLPALRQVSVEKEILISVKLCLNKLDNQG